MCRTWRALTSYTPDVVLHTPAGGPLPRPRVSRNGPPSPPLAHDLGPAKEGVDGNRLPPRVIRRFAAIGAEALVRLRRDDAEGGLRDAVVERREDEVDAGTVIVQGER